MAAAAAAASWEFGLCVSRAGSEAKRVQCGMVCRSRTRFLSSGWSGLLPGKESVQTLVAFSLEFSHNSSKSFYIFENTWQPHILFPPQQTYSSLDWTDYPHLGVSGLIRTPHEEFRCNKYINLEPLAPRETLKLSVIAGSSSKHIKVPLRISPSHLQSKQYRLVGRLPNISRHSASD